MNTIDTMALWARRYEPQYLPDGRGKRFSLIDLLWLFDRNAILELTPVVDGKPLPVVKPDAVRKVKVSLLDDGISAIDPGPDGWYEVYRTAPSGDLSKVRIMAHAPGGRKAGEVRLLVGRRSYDQYFAEDPIFEAIERVSAASS
jgi:hypothetical protein